MPVDDLRFLNTDEAIDTDVCIVGSGPAGWAVAHELSDTPLRVLMLESGGLRPNPGSAELNEIEDVGIPLVNGRERVLGGTSALWSGRCIGFDEIDYEERSWLPASGWPIDGASMRPYLARAAEYLGALPPSDDGQNPGSSWTAESPRLNPGLLRGRFWEDTVPVHVGRAALTARRPNLRIVVNATVTHLDTDRLTGRLTSAEIASSPDHRATVTARAFVLAAGGVENARVLLYSNRVTENGLGNEHDVVGRYFMDHPRDWSMAVHFDVADADGIRNSFGPRRLPGRSGRHLFYYGLALSAQHQRREGLVNCAGWPVEEPAADDPFGALDRLVAGPRVQPGHDARAIVSERALVLRGVRARLRNERVVPKIRRIGFLITSEQVPDPSSRISLSERRDRLGLPISKIDWRVAPLEVASQAVLATTIAREFQRLGMPRAQLADWVAPGRHDEAVMNDSIHPCGATRMSDDPRRGVVDAQCQVYGTPGLYVAGSSVFPTGGHANPTLMLVGLAIRLADHLSGQLSPSSGVVSAEPRVAESDCFASSDQALPSPPAPGGGTRTVAAITGASGFIGSRLAQRLLAEGTTVVCLVRRSARVATTIPVGAQIRPVDLTDVTETRAALDGVDVLYHCAYDWGDPSWNVSATRALIDACRGRVRRLVHLSSFVVYRRSADSMTEETPLVDDTSGYAHIKVQLEAEVMRAVREHELPATILQPTIVYGPRSRPWTEDPANMLRYGSVVVPEPGDGCCNVVYVDDVVSAMTLAAVDPNAIGERFLISGPAPVTWSEFYEAIATAVDARGPRYVPMSVISQQTSRGRRFLACLSHPLILLRRAAGTPTGERAITTVTGRLPGQAAEFLRRQLVMPVPRIPQYVHRPSPTALVARGGVSSTKAHRTFGYVPEYDFARGMIPTAAYLEEYVLLNP